MELLISIKGVTPLIALAFLADMAEVRRLRTLRKMNACPGLVPRAKNSGGKERSGHITRGSRKLTRTIFTQCVHHVAASSVSLDRCYREPPEKRGTGRARVVVIRKLCGMMRRMLLNGEQYRCMDRGLYQKKLRQHERMLKRMKEERTAAWRSSWCNYHSLPLVGCHGRSPPPLGRGSPTTRCASPSSRPRNANWWTAHV